MGNAGAVANGLTEAPLPLKDSIEGMITLVSAYVEASITTRLSLTVLFLTIDRWSVKREKLR